MYLLLYFFILKKTVDHWQTYEKYLSTSLKNYFSHPSMEILDVTILNTKTSIRSYVGEDPPFYCGNVTTALIEIIDNKSHQVLY